MLVVFGSINADLVFKVETLPKPGETVLCPSYQMVIGGKGSNQAAAAAKMTAPTRFIGHVGNDAYGPVVKGMLADAGVDCSSLMDTEAPTAIAVIGVDDAGENAIIVASGANLATHAGQLEGHLSAGATLLCQNEIRPEETHKAIIQAHDLGCRTILNLAPAGPVPDHVLAALDILIVNEHEARAVAGDASSGLDAVIDGLAHRFDLSIVLTLGADGACSVGPLGRHEIKAKPVQAVDTTGAGDCFSGILAARLDQGLDFATGLQHAVLGASLSCLAVGAQTAQPLDSQLNRELNII